MPKYMSQDEAVNRIKLYIESRHHGVKTSAANEFGVSKQFLGAVLKQKAPPSDKLLKAVNLEKVVLYERSNRS